MKKTILILVLLLGLMGNVFAKDLPGTLFYKICPLLDNVNSSSDVHLQNILQWDYNLQNNFKLSLVHLTELGINDNGVYEHVTKIILNKESLSLILYRKHYPNKDPQVFRHYIGISWKIKIW